MDLAIQERFMCISPFRSVAINNLRENAQLSDVNRGTHFKCALRTSCERVVTAAGKMFYAC